MARNLMKEVEQDRGQPIKTVLIESFRKHGSQKEVAEELGVNQSTVSLWITRLRLKKVTTLVEDIPADQLSFLNEKA